MNGFQHRHFFCFFSLNFNTVILLSFSLLLLFFNGNIVSRYTFEKIHTFYDLKVCVLDPPQNFYLFIFLDPPQFWLLRVFNLLEKTLFRGEKGCDNSGEKVSKHLWELNLHPLFATKFTKLAKKIDPIKLCFINSHIIVKCLVDYWYCFLSLMRRIKVWITILLLVYYWIIKKSYY